MTDNVALKRLERQLADATLGEMWPGYRVLGPAQRDKLIEGILAGFYAQPEDQMAKWRPFAEQWVEDHQPQEIPVTIVITRTGGRYHTRIEGADNLPPGRYPTKVRLPGWPGVPS